MFIQVEKTPNPEVRKFLPGVTISKQKTYYYTSIESAKNSLLAIKIFSIGGINTVLLGNDFISIKKNKKESWDLLLSPIFSVITDHLTMNLPIVHDNSNNTTIEYHEKDQEIVKKIEELLNTRIRPFISQDGGHVTLQAYKDGIVYINLQGACVDCPSSTVTLKSGIENILKHFLPNDIKEVLHVSRD